MKNILTAALLTFILLASAASAYAFTSIDFYREASKHKSINPLAATVHCAHETGEWTSRLWTECNNGAGIKTNKAWKMLRMPYVVIDSPEDEGGRFVKRTSSFRKYRNIDSFLSDYSRKIRDDYPISCRYNNNVWGYIAGLRRGRLGKWATDRSYFEKLTSRTVRFAPEVYGPDWRLKLVRQLDVAKTFGILENWQIKAISERLGD